MSIVIAKNGIRLVDDATANDELVWRGEVD
jgi:hypothetical protein